MFDFGLSKKMKQNAEVLAEQMHVSTSMIAPCDHMIFYKKTGLRSSLDFPKFQSLLGIVLVYNFDQALLKNRTLKKFCDYFTSSISEKFDSKFLTDYVEVSKRLAAMNEVGNNQALLGWVMYKLGIEDPSDDCIDFIYAQIMLKTEEAKTYFLKGARLFSPDRLQNSLIDLPVYLQILNRYNTKMMCRSKRHSQLNQLNSSTQHGWFDVDVALCG